MKWSIFVCLLVCLARFCEGGALRCPPGVTECTDKNEDADTKVVSAEDGEKAPTKNSETNIVVPNVTLSRKVRGYNAEPTKTCQPGQEFRMDCNKCLCDNEGLDYSCTRIDCNALARSKRDVTEKIATQCAAGSVFDRDCNVCLCAPDGQAAQCTLKSCVPKDTEHVTVGDGVPMQPRGAV